MRVALKGAFYAPDGRYYKRGVHDMPDYEKLPKSAVKVGEKVTKVEDAGGPARDTSVPKPTQKKE